MSSSEVEAAPVPTAARSNKKNSIWAKYGRHVIYSTFGGRKSVAVKDYDHEDSWCSERCDNANSALNLDEIVGLGIQQPPTKQVAKKREKKKTAATMVT